MKNKTIGIVADVLLFSGWALISVGAWLLSPCAGYITAGALAIAGGVFLERSADK